MTDMKARERTGILVERTVGSLNEVFKTDYIFADDMTINPKRNNPLLRSVFEWQVTHHPDDTSSDRDKRRLFSDLCMCTCQRLIADIRVLTSLYHHFHHLAHCVRYMHEKGVLHCDIKPNNIFVRAIESTSDAVTRVQLVLADFDLARNCHRDVSRHDGTFEKDAPFGTTGYHPNIYCPTIPYTTVAYSYLLSDHRPTARPARDALRQYKFFNLYATPFLDIYFLGLVFLSMFHRSKLTEPWYIHIKREMVTCTVYPLNPPYRLDHHHCSPAHVLLCHRLTGVNATLKSPGRHDLYSVLKNDVHGSKLEQYNSVVELRDRKQIDDEMYALLEAMTSPANNRRVRPPNIHHCIEVIQRCIAQ
jgi:serine/threonine protein kinase